MAVIAFDLGGTKLAGGLFNSQGKLVRKTLVPLEGRGGKAVGALIREQLKSLFDAARAGHMPITAIGVSVPGIVHAKTGKVWAPNIAGWKNYSLEKEIRRSLKLRIPIRIESDRTCYILGEQWRGVRDAIGAGLVVDSEDLALVRCVATVDDVVDAVHQALDRPSTVRGARG